MDSRGAFTSASSIVIGMVALAPTVTAVALQSIRWAITTGRQGATHLVGVQTWIAVICTLASPQSPSRGSWCLH